MEEVSFMILGKLEEYLSIDVPLNFPEPQFSIYKMEEMMPTWHGIAVGVI